MDTEKQRVVIAVTHCRVCGHELVNWILNFGDMPLANRYLKNLDEKDIYAPIEVMMCLNCGCVQLRHTVDPKLLYEDYLYTSSTSGSLEDYYRQYAQDTVSKLGWKPGDKRFVVGIGGNDGVLEKIYQSFGLRVLNIEASGPIARMSAANGVPTVCMWFNEDVARETVDCNGQADLITANHVFAHMHNIHDVVKGIKLLLKPGGTFIFEESYWPDMVAGNHFDQIYHEHVFYWTFKALEDLFFRYDMGIVDFERSPSQGGSIRCYVRHGMLSTSVGEEALAETAERVFDLSTYEEWNRRIAEWRTKCLGFLEPLKSVACYGAPAKFTMISEQLGFGGGRNIHETAPIDYAVEDSPIKVGRYTPGARIPIVDRQHFLDHPTEHCIITAQNYTGRIYAANPQYKGKWIVLKPEPAFL